MPEKRIERLDPALDRIIDTTETIHDLADGFGGEQGPAEGLAVVHRHDQQRVAARGAVPAVRHEPVARFGRRRSAART